MTIRLAISNIAWETSNDHAVAALLQQYKIDAIDIAPSKYFPILAKADKESLLQLRKWWESRGIAITGMQALLFGTQGLSIFGSASIQQSMLDHLETICKIAAELGATRLVFGSPKNRDCSGFSQEQADKIAVEFFGRLAIIAAKYQTVICLEPNPSCYGCNYMVNTIETAKIVYQVGHPAIQMQLDTGACTLNGEDPAVIIANHADIIGHIHASEPKLAVLGTGDTDHKKFAQVISYVLPNHVVSIEMLTSAQESQLVAIEKALQVADESYRQGRYMSKLNKGSS